VVQLETSGLGYATFRRRGSGAVAHRPRCDRRLMGAGWFLLSLVGRACVVSRNIPRSGVGVKIDMKTECLGRLQPLIFLGVWRDGFLWECICLTCQRWTYVRVGYEDHIGWLREIPPTKPYKTDYQVPGV